MTALTKQMLTCDPLMQRNSPSILLISCMLQEEAFLQAGEAVTEQEQHTHANGIVSSSETSENQDAPLAPDRDPINDLVSSPISAIALAPILTFKAPQVLSSNLRKSYTFGKDSSQTSFICNLF